MANRKPGLDVFFPVPRVETIGGRRFEILPLKTRVFSAFAQAATPFMALIAASDYRAALAGHAPAVCEALAIATGAEADWIGDLWPDETLLLMQAVFEVNLDFFARRLLPVAAAADAAMTAKMLALTGEPSSPGSPDAATDSPRSAS